MSEENAKESLESQLMAAVDEFYEKMKALGEEGFVLVTFDGRTSSVYTRSVNRLELAYAGALFTKEAMK